MAESDREPNEGATVVTIFKTDDHALLPLAEATLQSAGIQFQARSFGKADNLQWTLSQSPTIRPFVIELLVSSEDADKARDLLADLNLSTAVGTSDPAVLVDTTESQAIRLEDAASGQSIAQVSEAQLQQLISHLEETAPQQFVLDRDALDHLLHTDMDPQVIDKLSQALGEQDEATIRWTV